MIRHRSEPDYRGSTQALGARRDHFAPGLRAGLVDDWIETGSQALAVQRLVEDAGAELVAVAVIIDEAADDARMELPPIRSIVTAADLR